jgi:hypothetical protein
MNAELYDFRKEFCQKEIEPVCDYKCSAETGPLIVTVAAAMFFVSFVAATA